VRTDSRQTADELALMFRGLLAGDAVQITGIAACSTVPSTLRELRAMLSRYYADVPTVIIEPGVKTGVQLAIDNPKEVGSDRVMNTLAVHHLFGGPSIVVDFGTSTNYDVVSARGEFLGGPLAPGIEISVDALAARAAQLRKVELVRPRSVIGKNTVEALQAGIIFGFAAQVDGIAARIIAEIGPVRAVVATGGLAPLVISESSAITHYEPSLTLIGLRLAFDKNLG
jgi:type III pantothenate kinase